MNICCPLCIPFGFAVNSLNVLATTTLFHVEYLTGWPVQRAEGVFEHHPLFGREPSPQIVRFLPIGKGPNTIAGLLMNNAQKSSNLDAIGQFAALVANLDGYFSQHDQMARKVLDERKGKEENTKEFEREAVGFVAGQGGSESARNLDKDLGKSGAATS